MSDRESQQASIDASEASLPAENGSREVANDPPPLGRAEESVSDAGVAARTRFQGFGFTFWGFGCVPFSSHEHS